MKFSRLPLLFCFAPLLAMVSCESPIPRHGSFDHYYGEYMEMIKPEIEALDQDLADGLIDQRAHDTQMTALTDNVTEKVNNLLYYNHQLRENDWLTKGLPTPNNTPSASGGQRGGGITSGGRAGSFGGSQGSFAGFGGAGTKGSGGTSLGGLGGGRSGFGGLGGGQLPGFSGGGRGGAVGRDIGRVY